MSCSKCLREECDLGAARAGRSIDAFELSDAGSVIWCDKPRSNSYGNVFECEECRMCVARYACLAHRPDWRKLYEGTVERIKELEAALVDVLGWPEVWNSQAEFDVERAKVLALLGEP